MDKGFLYRLYWACAACDRFFAEGLNLSELYGRSEETRQREREFNSAMDALDLSKEDHRNLDDMSCSLSLAYEAQGFCNGFRLGVKLMSEVV